MKKRFLVLDWMKQEYAIPMEDLLQITEVENMVRSNNKHINVMLYQRRLLPVLDPVAMMGFTEMTPSSHTKVLMVEYQSLRFGIMAESVLGVMEMDPEDIVEPHVNERRFVTGICGGARLVDPNLFLNSSILSWFQSVYSLDMEVLEKGYPVIGVKAIGKEELLNAIRVESINFLIDATRKRMDDRFFRQAFGIHQMVEKL